MAKRRTRQEKIVARLRRKIEIRPDKPRIAEVKPSIVMQDESLPKVELKADLTRTAIVAIVALILQAGMFYFLNYWERG